LDKPVPQNAFYAGRKFKRELKKNSDFVFVPSLSWVAWADRFSLPVYVVGMPKLDSLFSAAKAEATILYAPTWNPDLTSEGVVDVGRLAQYGRVIDRRHPSVETRAVMNSTEALRRATIVISDYSSVGLEAITLNIPTILVENEIWGRTQSEHISQQARAAALRVYSQAEIERAIEVYLTDPSYLSDERMKYSRLLCDYQGESAARAVDVLEEILRDEVSL
jgi:CDP-glycerol glycerophosphotransferase (TagB/SpsB family)